MPNKKSPLYNYRSPRDYTVFNMGNKASPPFKMKSGNSPLFKQMGSSPVKQVTQVPTPGPTDGATSVDVETSYERAIRGHGDRGSVSDILKTRKRRGWSTEEEYLEHLKKSEDSEI